MARRNPPASAEFGTHSEARWIWEVRSKEEALEWAKRIPFTEGEVEIRQVFEAEDFGEAFTPELREQEERLRLRVEKR